MRSRPVSLWTRNKTVPVIVGGVTIGGGAPVVVQSMTNTDTSIWSQFLDFFSDIPN